MKSIVAINQNAVIAIPLPVVIYNCGFASGQKTLLRLSGWHGNNSNHFLLVWQWRLRAPSV